jgi:hypothetical protein
MGIRIEDQIEIEIRDRNQELRLRSMIKIGIESAASMQAPRDINRDQGWGTRSRSRKKINDGERDCG